MKKENLRVAGTEAPKVLVPGIAFDPTFVDKPGSPPIVRVTEPPLTDEDKLRRHYERMTGGGRI